MLVQLLFGVHAQVSFIIPQTVLALEGFLLIPQTVLALRGSYLFSI